MCKKNKTIELLKLMGENVVEADKKIDLVLNKMNRIIKSKTNE